MQYLGRRAVARVSLVLAVVATACGTSDLDGGSVAGGCDAALPDGTLPDGTTPDGTSPDGALPDGATPDGTSPDGALPDGAIADGGTPDADASDAKVEIIPTYVKASNARADGRFATVALDGDTLAVGAIGDASNATTINGDQANTAAPLSGAVYVFKRNGATWSQQAYIKPSNNKAGQVFGVTLALHGDTLAVGAIYESSASRANPNDTSATNAGAVYVFKRNGTAWSQEAYVKAAVPRANAEFGASLALRNDTLVVGATGESSGATTIGGNQNDSSAPGSGAAYVFTRAGTTWTQSAYLKPSNNRAGAAFGVSASLDGDTLAVGAANESSSARGVGGDPNDTSAPGAGAVYVFARTGGVWAQQAYVKATNTVQDANIGASFGISVALSGNTLAVGQHIEASNAKGIDQDETDTSALNSGAVFVFTRTGTAWSKQAYIKASNARPLALFGFNVALAGDRLLVGSVGESSNAQYVNNDQNDQSLPNAGAAYEFRRAGTTWSQTAYIKASNPRADAVFGYTLAVTPTSSAIGSRFESSAATGVGGNQADTSAPQAGAVYVYP